MTRRIMRGTGAAVLLLAMLAGCGKDPRALLPDSSGRAYEVLLATDDTACANTVEKVLSADCEALPQPEPRFDVVKVKTTTLNATTQMARSIVIVQKDGKLTTTAIRYEKDVYARPQRLVLISTPSAAALKRDLQGSRAEQLCQLLTTHEMEAEQARLRKDNSAWAGRQADSLFHVRMFVPKELTRHKQGKDFLWMSNDAPQAMRNICLYSYPGQTLRAEELIARRDSIMQRNIPGEHEDMYMQTARTMAARQEYGRLMVSGLWEMRGDMMGGPFVAHAIADSIRKRIVVAEAFVYAPEQMKRNIMRQLEAALYTFSINQ